VSPGDRIGPAAEEALAALFATPPAEFVATRNRLAAELARGGEAGAAQLVRGLRRPSPTVWAVNQLARRAPDEVAALLAAGAELTRMQARLLRGERVDDFLAAAHAERLKIAALVKRAEQLLAATGHKSTSAQARRMAQTLHSAAVGDQERRRQLVSGQLDEDLEPAGGFDLPAAPAAPVSAPAPAPRERARSKRDDAEERRRTAAASERERRQEAAARKLELERERRAAAAERKRVRELEQRVAAAERAVAARQRTVEAARTAFAKAEGALRAAERELATAEHAAEAARAVVGAAGRRRSRDP
jgi:hypothetical protein